VGTEGDKPPLFAVAGANTLDAIRGDAVHALIAGAILIVGSFLPWLRASASTMGTVTRSGTAGSDGWLTVVAGVVVIGAGFALLQGLGGRAARIALIVVGALALALCVYDFLDIADRFDRMKVASEGVSTSHGFGIYITAIGAADALVAGVRMRPPPLPETTRRIGPEAHG
jgi:hypothetical protein